MKHAAIYSLVAIMFLLAGCPAQTEKCVDQGSYEVPSWLPGKWSEVDKSGAKKDTYVLEKDSKKGNLKCYDVDSNGKIIYSKFRPVIMSSIAGKIFLSAYDSGDDVMSLEGYYLFEFRKVSSTEFVLAGIREKALDYKTEPSAIISFLEQNKDNENIFDESEPTRYKKQ